jgi:hypothetical protein
MASTIRLLDSMEWCKKFVFNRQLSLGNFKEPILTSANIIKQTILGPPLSWPWNRQTISFTSTIGVQDYIQSINCVWIEVASAQDIGVTPSKWYEIANHQVLGLDTSKARPTKIAAQVFDDDGNVTFRLMPAPDKAYPISITVQNGATLFTSLNDTWAPIPDRFSYIYQVGLLALMYQFADDPRFSVMNQKFVGHLLGAAQGLKDTDRNLFLSQWQAITGQPILNQISLQQGSQARAL